MADFYPVLVLVAKPVSQPQALLMLLSMEGSSSSPPASPCGRSSSDSPFSMWHVYVSASLPPHHLSHLLPNLLCFLPTLYLLRKDVRDDLILRFFNTHSSYDTVTK